jgi:hypothetical protein
MSEYNEIKQLPRGTQLVERHPDRSYVPTQDQTVPRQQFMPLAVGMFEVAAGDDGIVFSRT